MAIVIDIFTWLVIIEWYIENNIHCDYNAFLLDEIHYLDTLNI